MIREKNCPVCKKQFKSLRRDKTFCSRKCVYKQYNDKRPRKTKKSYIKANLLREKHIPQDHLEVIYGTLMGDACLILQTNNFHRLSLCHCEKQYRYLKLKREILNSIFLDNVCSSTKNSFGGTQYHAHSVSHKDLTNIFGIFYRKKKFISREVLELLTPTSLLFWYLDDGSMIKSSGNAIILCTDSFTLSENQSIKKWFWQKYQLECNLMPVKGGFSNKIYYRIRFNKENTIRFLNILSKTKFFQRALQTMSYKFFPYYN